MDKKTEALKLALELPFDEYMNWCWDWCRTKAEQDLVFADVWNCVANAALFQSQWAKRYWYHKNGVEI